MDAMTHTLLAVVCMAACYFWGRYLSKREIVENVIHSNAHILGRGWFYQDR